MVCTYIFKKKFIRAPPYEIISGKNRGGVRVTQSVSDKGSSRPAPMGLANMQKNKYADITLQLAAFDHVIKS